VRLLIVLFILIALPAVAAPVDVEAKRNALIWDSMQILLEQHKITAKQLSQLQTSLLSGLTNLSSVEDRHNKKQQELIDELRTKLDELQRQSAEHDTVIKQLQKRLAY
jgi:hypothetical protein